LPEQANGKFRVVREVKHRGSRLPVVSLRNSVTMGIPRASIVLDRDIVIHRLVELYTDGSQRGMWMTTLPQEIEQATRQLERARGQVLVGGLGLGLATAILLKNKKVQHVAVVEKSREVIDMVKPYLSMIWPRRFTIHNEDLRVFLKRTPKTTYDFAFYDTWCSTQQWVLTNHVWPLRRASQGIVDQANIECWNEDEMIGQVRFSGMNWCLLSFRERLKAQGLPDIMNTRPLDFRKSYRKNNREVWPFAAWVHKNRPNETEANEKLESYLSMMKDQPRFRREWYAYERYGVSKSGLSGIKKHENNDTQTQHGVSANASLL
jgi:hypothetical protein